jgi:solute:Na+ symporter, SSS family
VLQFFLIVFGFLPLVILGLRRGRLDGLVRLERSPTAIAASPPAPDRVLAPPGQPPANPMGVEWFGLAMGLGFVLSFGYWCTDFLVVQRAMAAKSMNAARRTPLVAAVPKMLFPFLVILPGMIAISLLVADGGDAEDGGRETDYNMAHPADAGSTTSRPACSASA